MTILTAALSWFHVLSAIGWLGAVMVFGMLIGPLLPGLSPATRGELIVKLFPKFIRYIAVFATATPAFGVALIFAVAGGDLGIMSPSNQFGLLISIGAAITIVVMLIAFVIVLPSASRIVKIVKSMQENPGPPPPELLRIQKRMRIGATAAMILLMLVLVFMVAAVNL